MCVCVCVCVWSSPPLASPRSADTKVCHPSRPAPLTRGRDTGRARSSGFWSPLACLGSLCISSQACMQTPTALCVLCSYSSCLCVCVCVSTCVYDDARCVSFLTHLLSRNYCIYIGISCKACGVRPYGSDTLSHTVYHHVCVCVCVIFNAHPYAVVFNRIWKRADAFHAYTSVCLHRACRFNMCSYALGGERRRDP